MIYTASETGARMTERVGAWFCRVFHNRPLMANYGGYICGICWKRRMPRGW